MSRLPKISIESIKHTVGQPQLLVSFCLMCILPLHAAAAQPAELELVLDINPGEAWGIGSGAPLAVGTKLYFRGCQPATGCEPWVSDGTSVGTFLLRDLDSSPSDSSAFFLGATENGIVLFDGDDGSTGRELWRTDGTAIGTFQVADLRVGAASALFGPANFATLGNLALFEASLGSSSQSDLYVYDTESLGMAPQVLVEHRGRPLGSLSATLGEVVVTNNPPGSPGIGWELLRTDGTAVTLIEDLNPSGDGVDFSPQLSAVSSGRVFFVGTDSSGEQKEIHSTDGNSVRSHGTTVPGPGDGDIEDLTPLAGGVTFTVDAGVTARELWYAPANGNVVRLLAPGAGRPSPAAFSQGQHLVYFRGDAGGTGQELWRTDGTLAGTFAIDLLPGTGGSNTSLFGEYLGRFYFKSRDSAAADFALWRTDGTLEGTELAPIASDEPFSAGWGAVTHNSLFIAVATAEEGRELWVLRDHIVFLDGFESGDVSLWF